MAVQAGDFCADISASSSTRLGRQSSLCHEDKPQVSLRPNILQYKKTKKVVPVLGHHLGIRKKEVFSGCTTSLTRAFLPKVCGAGHPLAWKVFQAGAALGSLCTEGKIGMFGFNAEALIV